MNRSVPIFFLLLAVPSASADNLCARLTTHNWCSPGHRLMVRPASDPTVEWSGTLTRYRWGFTQEYPPTVVHNPQWTSGHCTDQPTENIEFRRTYNFGGSCPLLDASLPPHDYTDPIDYIWFGWDLAVCDLGPFAFASCSPPGVGLCPDQLVFRQEGNRLYVDWDFTCIEGGQSGSLLIAEWIWTKAPAIGYDDDQCSNCSIYQHHPSYTDPGNPWSPPPLIGACCYPDLQCSDTTNEPDCIAAGGIWYPGVDCSGQSNCEPTGEPPGGGDPPPGGGTDPPEYEPPDYEPEPPIEDPGTPAIDPDCPCAPYLAQLVQLNTWQLLHFQAWHEHITTINPRLDHIAELIFNIQQALTAEADLPGIIAEAEAFADQDPRALMQAESAPYTDTPDDAEFDDLPDWSDAFSLPSIPTLPRTSVLQINASLPGWLGAPPINWDLTVDLSSLQWAFTLIHAFMLFFAALWSASRIFEEFRRY